MTQPTGPIYERAAQQFEIPGHDDIDRLSAILKTAVDERWLSQGPENLMHNVPELWEPGCRR